MSASATNTPHWPNLGQGAGLAGSNAVELAASLENAASVGRGPGQVAGTQPSGG
jgi:hypothetical protein